jgi:hypothetical protein
MTAAFRRPTAPQMRALVAVEACERAGVARINQRIVERGSLAFDGIALANARLVTARQIAGILWPPDPDRPETTRRTYGNHYGAAGAVRGTYPMMAARLLHRCTGYGWLRYDPDPETHQSRWALTVDGRGWALMGSKGAAR